ncbi:BRG1 brm-associated factor 53A like actin [Cryptosporidium sp. chipmunk genotype I]|uniref:BRG1 brm-associated factor 53A like actin n=1 Tax=Cryptosporidium sp. chipmunk genotype I TaxID=1280935 RepID=UPI00351A9A80|nr:BRG1 brm-associated factor 53A like actin [Cryptosporidium sp. chipmunk genotype I]
MSGKETFIGGDDVGAIIVDVGSYMTKIGYGGEDCPRQVWPSVVGVRENGEKRFPLNFLSYLEDISVEPCLKFVDGSLILNEDVFEEIIGKTAGKVGLSTDLREHPILLTEPSKHNRQIREKEVEIMFEKFDVPAVYTAKKAILSAFSVGRSSGLVVDIGATATSIVPILDGYTLQKPLCEYPVGGDFLDDQIARHLLKEKNLSISPSFSFKKIIHKDKPLSYEQVSLEKVASSYIEYGKREVLRNIKESICRCAEHEEVAKTSSALATSTYELPDGTLIDSEPIGIRVPECLLNPEMIISDTDLPPVNTNGFPGLCSAISNTIIACDIDIRKDLIGAVILTGGTSIIPGLADRVSKSLAEDDKLSGGGAKLKIISPNSTVERKFSSWIGGSILASLGSFQQMWFSKEEYIEHGVKLVERKCSN